MKTDYYGRPKRPQLRPQNGGESKFQPLLGAREKEREKKKTVLGWNRLKRKPAAGGTF